MRPAPLFDAVADAPDGGRAFWLTARDGVRLRIGVWDKGAKGTVLLFPGRTEYIEKYGRAAKDLAARGFSMLTIDWRGQGLSDRLLDDPATGHVHKFTDYQHDVSAMCDAARTLGLPKPWFLLAHSMGGCTGLRALMEELPVAAAVFSAPMWGIGLRPHVRPAAWALSWISRYGRFGHRYSPGTVPDTYVSIAPFEDNLLTTDTDMYAYMQNQLSAHPGLALGGPSLSWLYAALTETRKLRARPSPDIPTLTYLGSNERIIDTASVHARMSRWPSGKLQMVNGAEHEVLMETPDIRKRVYDESAAFFTAHS